MPKIKNDIISDKLHFPEFKNDDLISTDLLPVLKENIDDILYGSGQSMPKFKKILNNDKYRQDKIDNSTSVSKKIEQDIAIY